MAQNWEIDPKTGDYVLQGGAPKQTDSLNIPAYIRLKTPRTKWMYAPDEKYGSDFYNIKKRQSVRDANQIETIAANALQPIADDGRASSVEITTTAVARHGVGLKADLVTASGKIDQIVIPALGV